jgi:hypothetical protein
MRRLAPSLFLGVLVAGVLGPSPAAHFTLPKGTRLARLDVKVETMACGCSPTPWSRCAC